MYYNVIKVLSEKYFIVVVIVIMDLMVEVEVFGVEIVFFENEVFSVVGCFFNDEEVIDKLEIFVLNKGRIF